MDLGKKGFLLSIAKEFSIITDANSMISFKV